MQLGLTLENIIADDDLEVSFRKSVVYNDRVSKNMTRKEVSKFLGISVSAYRSKELGTSEFTASEISKLMVLFNREFYDIFTIDGKLIKE